MHQSWLHVCISMSAHSPPSSLEREAQCQMFMAAAYQDLHLPLIKLLWAPVWYPGCDMDSCVKVRSLFV